MLEIWGMRGTLSLPPLPGPFWPEGVVPDRVLSMGQIELNCVIMQNWITWNRTISTLAVRVFANGPGDLGSIPGRVIPKTQKMVLDASLLNTQHYKVRIKGKVEPSREGVAPYPTSWCSSYRKGSLRVTLDYGRQLYLLTYAKLNCLKWNCFYLLNWNLLNRTVFDIETVLTLSRIVWNRIVLTFNSVSTKTRVILNWIVWIRTVWLNWISWNRNVFDNETVYSC